jgi:hypothetical protein
MRSLRRLILVVLLVVFMAPPISAEGCTWKCVHTIDTTNCEDTGRERFGNYQECQISTQCTIVVTDPDGPGGNGPVVLIQCRYDCNVTHCIWV